MELEYVFFCMLMIKFRNTYSEKREKTGYYVTLIEEFQFESWKYCRKILSCYAESQEQQHNLYWYISISAVLWSYISC